MDLDYRMMSWQHNVWSSGKPSHVQAVSQSQTVQRAPQTHFGLRVFSLDSCHHP
jgi:hypothetical protein